jgi:hypothetical protein
VSCLLAILCGNSTPWLIITVLKMTIDFALLAVAKHSLFFVYFVQLKVIGDGGDPDGHDDDEDEHH